MQANKCTTLNDKFVIEDNENEKNYESEFKDVKIEFNKNDIVYDSIPSKIEKLQNNLNQNNNKNFQMNNLNLIESDNLRKLNLQNKTKSNILDDKIKLNHENEYIYSDFISNIKITNVVSLAPEEFENVTSDEQKKVKNRTSQNRNSILHENDIFMESNLKRKCDKITMNPIMSYINESKRLKKSNNVIGETSKSSCISTNALINVSSNKNNLQIIHYNENNTSINDCNIQNKESHIQIKKNCNVEDILCTSNTKCLPKIDTSNNLLYNKTDLTNEENTYTYIGITNDANKEFENIKIDNNIKNVSKIFF